ncbi:ABC transporter ABCE [Trema orientale]|uniref:ABC transporter ABCE n=1 Tax=Trema orientale TaxID=63057 RepID=A0A2P5F5Y2_TREOI|nr:ABC transporter ABCE [Trema orientale]
MALSFSPATVVSAEQQVRVNLKTKSNIALKNVKNLVKTIGIPSIASSPQESLQTGNWVKLICGASFEDVADIRNLSLVYTLAGVDCIDCAADASVVSAVNEGIEVAREIVPLRRPWVMISVNDDEDLHFRKAEFDPEDCPLDCSRPCQKVCPANAISLEDRETMSQNLSHGATAHLGFKGGVLTERCYGCGRCFPVCPYDKISVVTYMRDATATAELIISDDVDALEIHTSGRQTSPFKELWDDLGDSIRYLRLVAVSLPDIGETTITSMNTMYSIMKPHLHCLNLWQLDGRPMSGDIGRGATRESIAFALRLAASQERPNGFLQLAGGTNAYTVDGLKKVGLFKTKSFFSDNSSDEKLKAGSSSSLQSLVAGVAYGGYARKIVGRILSTMQSQQGATHIEQHPEHLLQALKEAISLVGTVKYYDTSLILPQ